MTWKEYSDQYEDCKQCPLLKAEICPGGIVSYGGVPIYPPCCDFDDDTDLDEFIETSLENERRYEEWEDKRIRDRKMKEEKNKAAAQKRKETNILLGPENSKINEIRKSIKEISHEIKTLEIRNSFNAMFFEPTPDEGLKLDTLKLILKKYNHFLDEAVQEKKEKLKRIKENGARIPK